jgi:type IV secretory pathway VirB4 component
MLEDILRADFLLPNGEYSDMDAIPSISPLIKKFSTSFTKLWRPQHKTSEQFRNSAFLEVIRLQ